MSYYNTTNLTGNELKEAINKAANQEEKVLLVFKHTNTKKLSASQVFKYLNINCPITSIRRAISYLKSKGKLLRLDETTKGLYGAKEHYYQLV